MMWSYLRWSEDLWRYPPLWVAACDGRELDDAEVRVELARGLAERLSPRKAFDALLAAKEYGAADTLLGTPNFVVQLRGERDQLRFRLRRAILASRRAIEQRGAVLRLASLRLGIDPRGVDAQVAEAIVLAAVRGGDAAERLDRIEATARGRQRERQEQLREELGSVTDAVWARRDLDLGEARMTFALWSGNDMIGRPAPPWPFRREPPTRVARWMLGRERRPAGFAMLAETDLQGRTLIEALLDYLERARHPETARRLSEALYSILADATQDLVVEHLTDRFAVQLPSMPAADDLLAAGLPPRLRLAFHFVETDAIATGEIQIATSESQPPSGLRLTPHDILASSQAPDRRSAFLRCLAGQVSLDAIPGLKLPGSGLSEAHEVAHAFARWLDLLQLRVTGPEIIDRIVYLCGGNRAVLPVVTRALLDTAHTRGRRPARVRAELVSAAWRRPGVRRAVADVVLADLDVHLCLAVVLAIVQLSEDGLWREGVAEDEVIEWIGLLGHAHGPDAVLEALAALVRAGVVSARGPQRWAMAGTGPAEALIERAWDAE